MDFEFNENQLDLQKMVRELAEKEIGPRAKENDEKDVFPVHAVSYTHLDVYKRQLRNSSWVMIFLNVRKKSLRQSLKNNK